MNNKQHPKVRLVKCPKCAKLLPEPVHVPLYTCGGCGTTLKAKYYKGHLKDITSSSHGRDATRTNGIIHERTSGESSSSSRRSNSSGEHAASQDKGRDQNTMQNPEDSEQKAALNSSYHTSLSKESTFLKNKDTGGIDNKLDCFVLKDLDKERDEDAAKSCSSPAQNGAASSSHHTALSESTSTEKNETGEINNKFDQFNSQDQVSNGFLTGKKEPEQHSTAKSATGGHNGQDEWHNSIAVDNHQKKQIGNVNIGRETCTLEDSQVLEKKEQQEAAIARKSIADEGDQHEQKQIGYVVSSSLTESLDVKNPVGPDDFDHEISEGTREMHLVRKHPNQDQHQQNQDGYVNSAKEASSLPKSSAIINPTEYPNIEVSKDTRKIYLERQHSHQEQDEQKQTEYVNSSKEASSLTMSSAVENLVGTDACDREVSVESREMHPVGKHPHQDQCLQNQVGCVDPAKEASSLSKSSAIMSSTEYSMHVVSKEARKIHVVGQLSHQEQDEQKQSECAYSSKDASSSTVSSAVKNLVGPDASDHEVSEETREMPLAGKHFQQDQHEHKQVGCMNSVTNAASLSESPAINNPTEYPEVSKETTKIHLVEKHLHKDKHGQKQTEYVNSSNNSSSLTASSGNPVEADASDHEVSEKTERTHLLGKYSQQDQNRQKRDPAKDTTSLTESSAIEKLAQLAFANSAKDASDLEASDEKGKMHLLGKQPHQYTSGSESDRFGVDKPENLENSGNEFGNGRDLNNFVECTVEQSGEEKSTDITKGENDSVHVPSSANNLKASPEMGPTKVSKDPRNKSIIDHGKGTSKQSVNKFRDPAVYTNAEVGSSLKDVPGYPSKRSPAYDGSVSSLDGNDDQVAEQAGKETLSPNTALAGYDGAEESPEWTNNLSESIMYRRNSRVAAQAKSSSSVQLDKKLKNSMVDEGPLEEYDIPQKINRYRPNRDSFLPRVPNRRRSSEVAFETGSSSSYALHDEPLSHHMYHHPYRRRSHDVPHWREKEFLPAYYNYETSGEIYDRPRHHAYADGRRRVESWSRSGALPRIPYSGEIFNARHPYMHRYPEDRRWSAQLPPPAACCHQEAYMGPAWETRWDPYDSYPTSPRQYVESESSYALGHDTISLSDDQRHKDQLMRRLYFREKRQALKRQFHPTAGGAPFISCYSCFNILQLPEDFLISNRRRRTHKLQCGACSSVLELSLENESSLARCETNVDRNANQAVSSSHMHHSRHSSLNSVDDRELLSHDCFQASDQENRKLFHGSSRRGERMEGELEDDAAPERGRPAKVSWQMPDRSKSPLHRLMGYSSPKDLLSPHEADDDLQ